ncbi:hypothetical protein ACJX0J_041624, partial [Zea mays]
DIALYKLHVAFDECVACIPGRSSLQSWKKRRRMEAPMRFSLAMADCARRDGHAHVASPRETAAPTPLSPCTRPLPCLIHFASVHSPKLHPLVPELAGALSPPCRLSLSSATASAGDSFLSPPFSLLRRLAVDDHWYLHRAVMPRFSGQPPPPRALLCPREVAGS